MDVMLNMEDNTELTEFSKHSKLASELRHHILTYCNSSTVFNYSQCSNICNSEVQRFNTEPPKTLDIKQHNDRVIVKMVYDDYQRRYTEKEFMISDSENTMEEMKKYIMKCYKYVGVKTTTLLKIDVKQWPTEVMKLKYITNIAYWNVTICKSMYNDFMAYIKNNDPHIYYLTLLDCTDVSDRATIQPDFFKLDLLKRLQTNVHHVKSEIDRDDFFKLKKCIRLKSSISFDDIRAKVRNWNDTKHGSWYIIAIELPEDDDRELNIHEIFPSNQFDPNIMMNDGFYLKYKVGKVIVGIEQGTSRKVLSMEFVHS